MMKNLIGKRVAIYGPNYIWRGILIEVTKKYVILEDVYQVYETGSHDSADCNSERIGDRQVFPISSICNIGVTKWA